MTQSAPTCYGESASLPSLLQLLQLLQKGTKGQHYRVRLSTCISPGYG